jgi:ABC-type sugar transport system permease subunit
MTVIASVKARWQHANQRGDISTALLALAPAAILFLIFNVYPLFYSGYLSLLEWMDSARIGSLWAYRITGIS